MKSQGVFEHVLVCAIVERHAVVDDVRRGGVEEVHNQRGHRTRHAAVGRRIFGMGGVVPSAGQAAFAVKSVFPTEAMIAVMRRQKPYLYFALKQSIAASAKPARAWPSGARHRRWSYYC